MITPGHVLSFTESCLWLSESPDEQHWQFPVALSELYTRPSSHPSTIPSQSIFHLAPPLFYSNREFPASYFKVQVLKAATWWETNQHVGHKRMNLCQLKSGGDEGGDVYALVCVGVHSHDNHDENTHFLAQWAHIRGPLGRGLPNNTFNVIAQWLLFVSGAARCEPHKNSKAKWIRIWEKRWLNQAQWIGGD